MECCDEPSFTLSRNFSGRRHISSRRRSERPKCLFSRYRYREGVEPILYGAINPILFPASPEEDGPVDFSRIPPAMIEDLYGFVCWFESRRKSHPVEMTEVTKAHGASGWQSSEELERGHDQTHFGSCLAAESLSERQGLAF